MSCDEACVENISWLAQHFGTLKRFLSSKGSFENMAKRGDSPPPFGIHFRTDGSVSASAGFDANDISRYTLQIMQAMGSLGIFARCSESPDVFVGGSDKKKVEGQKINEIAKEQEEEKKADASSASTSMEKGSEKKSNTGGGRKKPKAKSQKKSHKKK